MKEYKDKVEALKEAKIKGMDVKRITKIAQYKRRLIYRDVYQLIDRV